MTPRSGCTGVAFCATTSAMLALTDTQLAQLAIAATAVPQAKRRRWLHKLAAELDGDPNQNNP
jgi:hypothetical protein